MNIDHNRYLHAMGIQPWQLAYLPQKQLRLAIIGDTFNAREIILWNAMLEAIHLEPHAVQTTPIEMTGNFTQQISDLRPAFIIVTDETAAHTLLNTQDSFESLRGKIHTHAATHIPLIVTFHPAWLLKYPLDKTKAFTDLQLIGNIVTQ